MIFGVEAHLGSGVTRAFVIPSANFARTLASNFVGSIVKKAHKDSDYTATNVIID